MPEAPPQNNVNNLKGKHATKPIKPRSKASKQHNAHAKQPRGKMSSATTGKKFTVIHSYEQHKSYIWQPAYIKSVRAEICGVY